MLSRIKGDVTLLLMVLELTFAAMVLPRPPSSPNHIRHEYVVTDSKMYNEKIPSIFFQSTNVEKPEVSNVKLLEIEVQNVDDKKPMNLHGFVEAVLDERIEQINDTYPSPEVVPNSILGVRNVGLPARFQPDKKLLFQTPGLETLDEKLYYLKHNSPKVYVNVRGHTGNFRKGSLVGPKANPKKTKATVNLRETSTIYDKKLYSKNVPKKYDPLIHGLSTQSYTVLNIEDIGGDIEGIGTVKVERPSTTENPVITSSELPKQIPAPPSKVPIRFPIVHTTPVQRQPRRMDFFPESTFIET